jgi:hypothetical protein
VSEYQGNDETAALEDEEVAMPAANPAAEQASPGTMEDDETTGTTEAVQAGRAAIRESPSA